MALGLDRHNRCRVREETRALTVGFLLAIVVTLGFAALARAAHLQSKAFEPGLRPVSHLIDTPDFLSVVVAFLAGVVGIVSLAFADRRQARGSLVQLLLNVVVLVVVGVLTLRVQRRLWQRATRDSGLS
ncbi:DUF389 domain-containing protein [Streptomyces sp. NPDC054834]